MLSERTSKAACSRVFALFAADLRVKSIWWLQFIPEGRRTAAIPHAVTFRGGFRTCRSIEVFTTRLIQE